MQLSYCSNTVTDVIHSDHTTLLNRSAIRLACAAALVRLAAAKQVFREVLTSRALLPPKR